MRGERPVPPGVRLVDLMLANKIIRPADVTQAKAAHFGAEVVNLNSLKVEDEVIAAVPRHIARSTASSRFTNTTTR